MVDGEEGVVRSWQIRRQPRRRCVAGGACSWPAGSHMIRIRCPREIRCVTRIAVGRCAREDIVDVATCAWHGGMRARQWEGCAVVVEDCSGP